MQKPASRGKAGVADAGAWLDDFFRAYYASRPVNATFIGVHDHDHRWPDLSDSGAGDAVAEMEALLARPVPVATSLWESLDLDLARGFLEIQRWEYGSRHFHRGNPSFYTGEAAFGLLGLFLTAYAPLQERVDAAVRRLEGLPAFLDQAAKNVRDAPGPWTARARTECRGLLAFLREGVPQLVAERDIRAPRLVGAARAAAGAVEVHRIHLESLPASDPGRAACGGDALDRYLRRGHFLSDDAGEIARFAEDELARADGALVAAARRLGVEDPARALDALAELHPPADAYYDRYREVWTWVRELVEQQELLTWPDFPIRFVPRPSWTRAAAPDLYFLYYRSPAAFGRPPVHEYLVAPVEVDMPEEERAAVLRAHNDAVILLNHVIHHGGPGHHVQNWHAFRSESRVGRIAAVDCASRIALFCGGTMAEGWACYATDLLREAGGLTSLQELAERQARRRMCARAVVDVRLHQGRMSLEEAARFYRERAGMGQGAAWSETVKNSMFPGAALMYLLGTDALHRLRADMKRWRGADFTLREFHDEVLSFGSVPVSRIAAEMERRHAPTRGEPGAGAG